MFKKLSLTTFFIILLFTTVFADEFKSSKYYLQRYYDITQPYWNQDKYFWETDGTKISPSKKNTNKNEDCTKPRPYRSCKSYDEFLTKIINRPEIKAALEKELIKENPQYKEILQKSKGNFKYENGNFEYFSSIYNKDDGHLPHILHAELETEGRAVLTTSPTTQLFETSITRDVDVFLKKVPSFKTELTMGEFTLKLKGAITAAALLEAMVLQGVLTDVVLASPHPACQIAGKPAILLNPTEILSKEQKKYLSTHSTKDWNATINGVDQICYAYCDAINQYIKSDSKEHHLLDCLITGEKEIDDYLNEKQESKLRRQEYQKETREIEAQMNGYKIQDGQIKTFTIPTQTDRTYLKPANTQIIK